jgi:hypothetical protein
LKRNLLWLLALGVAIYLGYLFLQPKPQPSRASEVPIPDGATIDFSSGKPVVRADAGEKAIIDAAVKEMNEAAKNIRFEPLAPPPVELPKPAAK